jgi:hypothetical protein
MTIKWSNGKVIWAWISIGAFFAGMIANGAVQYKKVDNNVEEIKMLKEKQENDHEILIRIEEKIDAIKEDIRELKDVR